MKKISLPNLATFCKLGLCYTLLMPEPLVAVTLKDILDTSARYQQDLGDFLAGYELDELDGFPLDHIAYKAADTAHYLACRDVLTAECTWGVESQVDGRPISTFHYDHYQSRRVRFGVMGEFHLVELIHPRAGKEGQQVGFDHIERVWPDLDAAREYLKRRGVVFTEADNGHHQTLVMVINQRGQGGQEIKITNKSLLEVHVEEEQAGQLTYLKRVA